jgi:hypothetical protein
MSDIQETWFIVVDQDRNVIGGMSADCVKMSRSDTVQTFLAAALPLLSNILRCGDMKNLKVCRDIDSNDDLSEDTSVWGLGVIAPNPLVIVAGEQEQPTASPRSRTTLNESLDGPRVILDMLDSYAAALYVPNEFHCPEGRPTFRALLAAVRNRTWTPRIARERMTLYDDEGNATVVEEGQRLSETDLDKFFDEEQWNLLIKLDRSARIHMAGVPLTVDGKPYIILPPEEYDETTCDHLRHIARVVGLVDDPSDLIIVNSDELSESE